MLVNFLICFFFIGIGFNIEIKTGRTVEGKLMKDNFFVFFFYLKSCNTFKTKNNMYSTFIDTIQIQNNLGFGI
jgi:hypothetical protein